MPPSRPALQQRNEVGKASFRGTPHCCDGPLLLYESVLELDAVCVLARKRCGCASKHGFYKQSTDPAPRQLLNGLT